MARDEFFADVRRAVQFMAPRVEADIPFKDPSYIERMLRGTDLWLSTRVVAAFDPADFEGVVGNALGRAVAEFREVAVAVDPHEPTRQAQRDAALAPFQQIVQIVQNLVFEDWLAASTALIAEAESWAREEGWPTRRFPREVTEDFIGNYELDRLVYSTEGAQLALIPLSRFAPGTDGMFDLAVMPAYDSMMIVRERGQWFIHPLPGQDARQDWSKNAFVSKSHDLARMP